MSRIIIELEKEELRLMMEEAVKSVIEKNTTREAPAEVPEILNVEQVCRLLNMKRSTLYQFTHKSKIPFSKKGKTLYFSRTEIYNWIADGRILTEAELQENAISAMVQNNKSFTNEAQRT